MRRLSSLEPWERAVVASRALFAMTVLLGAAGFFADGWLGQRLAFGGAGLCLGAGFVFGYRGQRAYHAAEEHGGTASD